MPRGRVTLACILAVSLLLAFFPRIDLAISGLFYRHAMHFTTPAWSLLLQKALSLFLVVSMLGVVAVHLYQRRLGRNPGTVSGRKVLYLFVILILGPGLVVNFAFKDHFGRARPREVAEFGGSRQFTPAFVISHECRRNCSFTSGDAAAAFFSLALARAFSRRRVVLATAIGFGAMVSLSRIAVGAHFFSDTVISFFVMWILTDVLHHYLLSAPAVPVSRAMPIA